MYTPQSSRSGAATEKARSPTPFGVLTPFHWKDGHTSPRQGRSVGASAEHYGIQMRWHDLRHFAVSLWIEQGFPPRAIMEFAGHSSIQLTFDLYGHLLPSPDHQQGMAEIEAKLLG